MTSPAKPPKDGGPPLPPPHPHRWAGLMVLSFSLLIVMMDLTILNVALPDLSAELAPSSTGLLWIVDIYSLVVAGLLVTAATIGDRWGRRRALLLGFALFAAASALILVADTTAAVIAVRALLGIGGALIMPSTLSMIRTLFTEPRERATALGVWATMASLGGALGPIVGGALLERFSWHSAFLVNVPIMAVAIVATLLLLPESRSPRPARWDLPGVLLSLTGMVALIYGIKHITGGPATPHAWLPGVLGITLLALFVRRCLRADEPMLEVRLFRRPAFTAGTVTALTSSFLMAGAMLLLAQWMQLVPGYSPLETGVRLLPMAIAAGIVSPLAPTLAGWIGARTVMAGGLAVSGVGCAVLSFGPQPLGYPTVAVALTLVGCGLGSLAVASAVIMAGAPSAKAGSAAAIEESSYELGAALGVAILGTVAAAVYRSGLDVRPLSADASGEATTTARESLAGALGVARELGERGAGFATHAQDAFTHALTMASLVGGVILVTAAAIVAWLAPKDLDVADSEH